MSYNKNVQPPSIQKSLLILGTRGIPAQHGGFETFAERLALYLVEKGWRVTVYCQQSYSGKSPPLVIDHWQNVRRVTISTTFDSSLGSIIFDWACLRHAMKEPGVPLVLGYNTALFTLLLRLIRRPILMNMDGIEWKRAKWGVLAKVWFYINEWSGALVSSVLIADHPIIADHLATRRNRASIEMIPYGADHVSDAPKKPVEELGVTPGKYFLSIGRIEPENQILEMISAYARQNRNSAFICLGNIDPNGNAYHQAVVAAANGRVLFPGAIYDRERVQSLRFHALAYCHGHTVGGTNPSLVEALGAGSAIIAHDNKFNRWVAGDQQLYFKDVISCAAAFDRAEMDYEWLARSRNDARKRFLKEFTWPIILERYENVCTRFAQANASPKGTFQ